MNATLIAYWRTCNSHEFFAIVVDIFIVNYRSVCQPVCSIGFIMWLVGFTWSKDLEKGLAVAMVGSLCHSSGTCHVYSSHWYLQFWLSLAIHPSWPLLPLLFFGMETSAFAILGNDSTKVSVLQSHVLTTHLRTLLAFKQMVLCVSEHMHSGLFCPILSQSEVMFSKMDQINQFFWGFRVQFFLRIRAKMTTVQRVRSRKSVNLW